jgi:hypothetical protein
MRNAGFGAGLAIVLAALSTAPGAADEILLPGGILERGETVRGLYRFDLPGTGTGDLRIEWTDAEGRVADRRVVPFTLDHGSDVSFSLDLRRAVTLRNDLRIHASRTDGMSQRRESDAEASFIVSPPAHPWSDYEIIMWQPHSAPEAAGLKALGVGAGVVHGDRADPSRIPRFEADPLLQNGLRWYVENIATDFYSAYHRWSPDRPVNWRFTTVQSRYRKNPFDRSAAVRDPSLSDPIWLDRIRRRIVATVATNKAYRPLYYNLADEAGIADLAAYWDFDLSRSSLDAMREWLKRRYRTLSALNREWGSDFASWDAVMPATTRQAMARTDGNFSSWSDFKDWMDAAFARSLAVGRDAVHDADPRALAGIEGGQVPGWGGYDYSRLVRSVDAMELYDGGENVDIVRSLDPGMVLLTTTSFGGAAADWSVWREWLRGTRGLILWDDKNDFVRPDGSAGERGREAASFFGEMRRGLGALVINSVRHTDPIAILYSPASMRVQWMLDWQPKGDAWIERGSEAEGGDDNTVRSVLSAFVTALRRQGLEPRFVTSAAIEAGTLASGLYRMLILPHAVALSAAESHAIRRFAKAGGTVIADVTAGSFDEHGKRLPKPLLADLAGAGPPDAHALADAARHHGIDPPISVTSPDGTPAEDVDRYLYRDGTVQILGLQRSHPPVAMPSPRETAVVVSLRKAAFAYDLLSGKDWGRIDRIPVTLDPVKPTLIALLDTVPPAPTISGPDRLHPGDVADLGLGLAGPSGAAFDVFDLEVLNPAGKRVPYYSRTIMAPNGVASARLPLAFNDPVGSWTIRVTDLPGGRTATAHMEVTPRL